MTKGGKVPKEYGGDAVCTAASEGDVPTIRMLHEFGMSVSEGDYDDRYPLHCKSLVFFVFVCRVLCLTHAACAPVLHACSYPVQGWSTSLNGSAYVDLCLSVLQECSLGSGMVV